VEQEIVDRSGLLLAPLRERLGLPGRYLLHTGGHDPVKDLGTLGWIAVNLIVGFMGFVFLVAFGAFVGFEVFVDEEPCEDSVELVVACTGSAVGSWHGPEATASPCATCAGSAAWLIEIMTTGFVCERVR